MYTNPRKTFDKWHELIDDICFNRITIKDAAEKWEISQPAISQWLKKHPSIKAYYYSRPWVVRQRALQFLPQECLDCQDIIDLLEDGNGDAIFVSSHNLAIEDHLSECEKCRIYQIEKRFEVGIPYRLDCPSINDLLTYIDIDGDQDTIITRHLLRCFHCKAEFSGITYSLDTETFSILSLAEKEIELYPTRGWREALNSSELLQELLDVVEYGCRAPTSEAIRDYCKWLVLRRSIAI